MLVYKRRPNQGVVFDGSFRVTLESLGPDVWLSLDDVALAAKPVISVSTVRTEQAIQLGIRSPMTISEVGAHVRVTTDPHARSERKLVMRVPSDRTIEIDGIEITAELLTGGEHHAKPLLHVFAPTLGCVIDLAVLSQYSYGADIATRAPQSVRIYRSEVWLPTADANEEAAGWTEATFGVLERTAASPRV